MIKLNLNKFKVILYLLIVLILIGTLGCQTQESKSKEQDLMQVKSTRGDNSKKIIFLMVDSLMAQAIDQGIKQQELPTFKYLIEHGQYYRDMVSSFPTMSVTIDSSLVMGAYSNDHHVPGLIWYSSDDKKVVNYGTGPMEVIRHGVNPTLMDALINLNDKDLNRRMPTLYDDLARLGLKSGSINGLIYRGPVNHTLSIPPIIQGSSSLPKEFQVKGPDFFTLGSLSNPLEGIKKMPDGPTNRMGLNDKYAIKTVQYLIQTNKLPDFLYVYLPDLDRSIHKKGPPDLEGVKKLDQQLRSLIETFGSPEEAFRKMTLIIAGDSGMTQLLPKEKNPVIDVPSFFKNYKVLLPGEDVTNQTEIILAVNETMAYVYKLNTDKSMRDIAHALTGDPRIDFVSWKDNEWIHVIQGATVSELKFKSNGKIVDSYQQHWTIEKDYEVLDLKVNDANQTLEYGEYPDALKRLSGALHSHKGEFLVVTAKPGYELADRSSPTHEGGGGHGSLTKEESLIPLIICGTDHKPTFLRIVDLKAYFLKLLKKE